MTGVAAATIVRLPVNQGVDAASAHAGDNRWQIAAQVYQQSGHYEAINMPNWTALRQASSDALNRLVATCGDPRAALDSLNDKLNSLLKNQGVGAG
jgi:ABC-type glycerol-3-phosphate transport system substrate-binding protein